MTECSSENKIKNVEENLWMLRPCDIYYEEYKECTSMKGRFHQKYIDGNVKECWQWKQDYSNCTAYEKNKNLSTLVPVIEHEEQRRLERLKGSNGNNVWEYRTSPPTDWNRPLPAHLTKTFNRDSKEDESKTCVIC